MARVEIFTKPGCPYCARAKALLDGKAAAYEEHDISADARERDTMIERSDGGRTVPQIFIDGVHIGGSDNLMTLERSGKLDALLGR